MEQSLLQKLIVCSASQEIYRLLGNPKVQYCVHKSSLSVSVLNQMNSIYTLQHYFHKIYFNNLIPSMPWFSKWSSPFMLYDQHFVQNWICVNIETQETAWRSNGVTSGHFRCWYRNSVNILKYFGLWCSCALHCSQYWFTYRAEFWDNGWKWSCA